MAAACHPLYDAISEHRSVFDANVDQVDCESPFPCPLHDAQFRVARERGLECETLTCYEVTIAQL